MEQRISDLQEKKTVLQLIKDNQKSAEKITVYSRLSQEQLKQKLKDADHEAYLLLNLYKNRRRFDNHRAGNTACICASHVHCNFCDPQYD
jgi:hypothetical protein